MTYSEIPMTASQRRQWASLVAQTVKNPPAMWETQVRSLGREDPLEKMTTHFGILAWRVPWTEEPGRQQSWDHKELDMIEHVHSFTFYPRRMFTLSLFLRYVE